MALFWCNGLLAIVLLVLACGRDARVPRKSGHWPLKLPFWLLSPDHQIAIRCSPARTIGSVSLQSKA